MSSLSYERLAIAGGTPVCNFKWPKWPRSDEETERLVLDVLRSERWAISGYYTGTKPYEKRFAEAFADFHKVPFCVPTASGSTALSIALEALGVKRGDEVLVPGLTWVACASSVAAIGAVPILVDIEPETLCMSADSARQAITERTRAVMLVHLYCTVGNIDEFGALAKESDIQLIEDCSQAHGASWNGQRVGTFGKVGTFSMQQSKVLTSGEGGAVITKNDKLYDLMQQLRADGRLYLKTLPEPGFMELEEVGDIQGRNRCMSEFQGAILYDRLSHLDEENRLREKNGVFLGELLNNLGIAKLLYKYSQVDARTFYHFCVRLNRDAFANRNSEIVAKALTGELGVLVEPVDQPLNKNRLYNPLKSAWIEKSSTEGKLFDPSRFILPNAEKAREECLTIPHHVLLSDENAMRKIAEAFQKVSKLSEQLSI